jgi:glucose/arabinose dehydrogenase
LSSGASGPERDGGRSDATLFDVHPIDGPAGEPDPKAMPKPGAFCSLPGSVVATPQGLFVMPGWDAGAHDLASWLKVPVGFCAHYFGTVPETRQLRFAPGGDLFAASPSVGCAGGAQGGHGEVVVLPDDNHDGLADDPHGVTFLSGLPSTQGMMFANGYFYFQAGMDGTAIQRVVFKAGDRNPSGAIEPVTTITAPQAAEHWPRVLDIAQDGTIYISNASGQGETCKSNQPVFGSIWSLGPNGSTSQVARGFRNPIAMRCETNHNVCLVAELALDGSGTEGGREKIVAIRSGDDWGFPCCATHNIPYAGVTYADTGQAPDCSRVAPESASLTIGDTPFGIDFETGVWPAPWTGRVFVALHGHVGTWEGARIVGIRLDPSTGMPMPATDLQGVSTNADDMMDFATGWYEPTLAHGRPAPITFAPDGRMFLGNDINGDVIWMAPIDLQQH